MPPGWHLHLGSRVLARLVGLDLRLAPHLHYEVFKEGKRVNPAHYYFNDLSPEQYEQLLAASENANQSFD